MSVRFSASLLFFPSSRESNYRHLPKVDEPILSGAVVVVVLLLLGAETTMRSSI